MISNKQTRVPQLQQLLYNGIVMRNNEKLGALGVGDRDLIVMVFNSSSSNARFVYVTLLVTLKSDTWKDSRSFQMTHLSSMA